MIPTGTERLSPQTPRDSAIPDPSSLSIKALGQGPKSPNFAQSFGSSLIQPPETPTARDHAYPHGGHRLSLTPRNQTQSQEVDLSLTARFKRAEWYGKGEFSEVYKVFQASETVTCQSYFAPTTGPRQVQTCLPDKVWIVKRSKAPCTSAKLRPRKLKEVAIMHALGKSDHVVHLVDSWEANSFLYIQTEFCEEGSLETFLMRQGNRGRLDDFRIWKIMIELAQVRAEPKFSRRQ